MELSDLQPTNKCVFTDCHEPWTVEVETLSGGEYKMCAKHERQVLLMENPSKAAEVLQSYIKSFHH